MKNILLFFLLFLFGQQSGAQDESTVLSISRSNFTSINLASTWNVFNSIPYPFDNDYSNSFHFRGFSGGLTFHKRKEKKYRGLNGLIFFDKIDKETEDVTSKALSISIGMGRYRHLFKGETFRLKYGGIISANYFNRKTTPNLITAFPTQTHVGVLGFAAESQLDYQIIEEKLFCFLALNFKIINLGMDAYSVDRPDLPQRQRNHGGFNLSLMEDTFMKLGIGLNI